MSTRTMTVGDVPAAASVGAEVGWPGRGRRFEFYVGHPFCEAVAAEVDGEVVGIGFGTLNGAVGWIGLVCVRPGYQGCGIGSALTERAAGLLENRGCRTLMLTAAEMGLPVYERLGFSTETHYQGFAGACRRAGVRKRCGACSALGRGDRRVAKPDGCSRR